MRLRRSFAILPLYIVAAIVLTWPVAAEFGRRIPWAYGMTDPLMQSYFLGWDWKTLPRNPAGVWDLPIFHPAPGALTFMDHMIGEAVLGAPVWLATGNMAMAYNTLILLSFVLSAWWTYRLLRLLGVSRPGSFLAGFLFAWSPYRYGHLGALNQLSTQFIPLTLFFAILYLQRSRFRDLWLTALTFVIQVWFGWYYAFHLVVALGLLFLYEMFLGHPKWSLREWVRIGAAALMVFVLILPGLYPYWREQRILPGFERTIGMTALWSADILDYLKTNPDNRLFRGIKGLTGDHSFLPGWITLGLAALTILDFARRRRRDAGPEAPGSVDAGDGRARSPLVSARIARWTLDQCRAMARSAGRPGYAVPLGLSAFLLSLGPILHLAGRIVRLPLPYAVAYFAIPGFSSMRVPARFAVLVLLASVILAGAGFDVLRRRIPGRRAGILLSAGLVLISAIFAWSVPVATFDFPHRDGMPPAYAWLAAHAGGPLLELPMPAHVTMEDPVHTRRQFYQLYHGRSRLDGVSGFVPRDYEIFRIVMQGFPRPGTLREARRFGARTILVHYGDLEPPKRDALRKEVEATEALKPLAFFGDDAVYELMELTR